MGVPHTQTQAKWPWIRLVVALSTAILLILPLMKKIKNKPKISKKAVKENNIGNKSAFYNIILLDFWTVGTDKDSFFFFIFFFRKDSLYIRMAGTKIWLFMSSSYVNFFC